jgi:2-polyprenyl-3-methyl-5-hydroxy-6-metoxy-1,4-benzoquinol methylase
MKSSGNYYRNIRFDVIKLVSGFRYKSILEVGGGEFPTLLKLTEDNVAEGWGIDPIERSGLIRQENIRLVQGYFCGDQSQDLVPDNHFDLLVAADVLEHISDTDLFFSTASKKLRCKGHLVLSVPNIRQIRAFVKIFVQGTFPRNATGLFDKTHLRWFCRDDVISFARAYGFRTLQHKYVGRFVPDILANARIFEFLALQNLFLFEKE